MSPLTAWDAQLTITTHSRARGDCACISASLPVTFKRLIPTACGPGLPNTCDCQMQMQVASFEANVVLTVGFANRKISAPAITRCHFFGLDQCIINLLNWYSKHEVCRSFPEPRRRLCVAPRVLVTYVLRLIKLRMKLLISDYYPYRHRPSPSIQARPLPHPLDFADRVNLLSRPTAKSTANHNSTCIDIRRFEFYPKSLSQNTSGIVVRSRESRHED